MILGIKCVFPLILLLATSKAVIEQVDDTDLVHLLTAETKHINVITFFTKSNCPECDELEAVVENIQNELQETLDAVVVKAHNSHMISIYDPSREPALIFFRKGIPLLYYGKTNEEEIIQTFSDNREPVVKELSDDNFEHLTQAASGATTGDWFVFFYSVDCVVCQRLYAVWEAVGAKLKRTLNVARVNRLEAGISTAKRFGITQSLEFILLRQGKVYRYRLKDYTPKSFIDFADGGYRKQTHPESVPPVPSVVSEYLVNVLAYNPQFATLGGITLCLLLLIFITLKCLARKKSNVSQSAKKGK